jgi:hypothetical protein
LRGEGATTNFPGASIFAAGDRRFYGTEGNEQPIGRCPKSLAQQGFCAIFTIPAGPEILRRNPKSSGEIVEMRRLTRLPRKFRATRCTIFCHAAVNGLHMIENRNSYGGVNSIDCIGERSKNKLVL